MPVLYFTNVIVLVCSCYILIFSILIQLEVSVTAVTANHHSCSQETVVISQVSQIKNQGSVTFTSEKDSHLST